jgi:hypothetical protein
MNKFLSRDQYYRSKDLQNLFSSLGIKAEEVISQEFDGILKLVGRRYRKLSLKYHPDKESDAAKKEIAERNFKQLCKDKETLEDHLNSLKEGRSINQDKKLLEKENATKQRKIDEILSHKSTVRNRAVLFFILVNVLLAPSSKVEFCLSQFAANGSMQNIAYQFYAFSTGVWPWLFVVSLCVICAIAYKKAKEGGSLEEVSDRLNRRAN